MATAATQTELNKFVKVVDEFKAKYARLISSATRNDVYATKNATLISDYETAVVRGRALNATIDSMVGMWSAFKRGYATVTDVTSTAIGDAIDTIRSWFGYDPAPGIGHYVVVNPTANQPRIVSIVSPELTDRLMSTAGEGINKTLLLAGAGLAAFLLFR